MRTSARALVVIAAMAAACSKRAASREETCEPAGAGNWARGDDRPRVRGASPGCAKARAPDGLLRRTVMVEGLARTYTLMTAVGVPTGRPAPLVFVFHGAGGSGERVRRFGFEGAVGGKAMVVYPDGLPVGDFGGRTGWDLRTKGRDFAFFDRMLETLGDEYCVDLGRVFVTGHSFGGWMTNRLGFARASRLRGIAPSAGGLSPRDCGGPPLAALVLHGRNDPTVAFAEGQAAHAMWAKAAGCRQTSQPLGQGTCVLHDGCAPEAPVGFCEHDQSHAFADFATAAIWSFFDRLR